MAFIGEMLHERINGGLRFSSHRCSFCRRDVVLRIQGINTGALKIFCAVIVNDILILSDAVLVVAEQAARTVLIFLFFKNDRCLRYRFLFGNFRTQRLEVDGELVGDVFRLFWLLCNWNVLLLLCWLQRIMRSRRRSRRNRIGRCWSNRRWCRSCRFKRQWRRRLRAEVGCTRVWSIRIVDRIASVRRLQRITITYWRSVRNARIDRRRADIRIVTRVTGT